MNSLLPEERETCLSMTGADHNTWLVFSDDPVMMRKLDRIAEVMRTVGMGKEYRLEAHQISLKPKRKPLSAVRKAQLAKQAELMRKRLVMTSSIDAHPSLLDDNDLGGQEGAPALTNTSTFEARLAAV